MSTRRNPFNENVDHLMDKIFSGKNSSRKNVSLALQKNYQEESLPEENGILHDLSFSLQDIRRTTEKIKETTKQMQQMTLQMWVEATQKKGDIEEKKIYKEEALPPREDMVKQPQHKRTVPYQAETSWRKTAVPQYRVEEILDDTVPERIRECKALARSPQGYRMAKEELFFHQAQMMEDYIDDQMYSGEFTWYFPTYQAMNAAQLRGYFTWRAQVRQGYIAPAPLSFAFVYIYELLHQIGAKTPEEGFFLLKTFWKNYREYNTQIDRYMQNWLCDYVVYYNLDQELVSDLQDTAFDNAMLVFLHPEENGEESYFAAICALSKYNIEGSKFYKDYSEDVRSVTCGVFRALTAYYEKHGKKTFSEKYFGTLADYAYQIFSSAVFYDYKCYEEYEYVFGPLHRYRCLNGHWSCEKYFGNRTKNKELGQILRLIDMRMRERYEYSALLKLENTTKLLMNLIEKEITRVLEEKKENSVPVIEIDVTKLSEIRRAAEKTRDRLIVEGSEEDAGIEFTKTAEVDRENSEICPDRTGGMKSTPKPDAAKEESVQINALLNKAEYTLLRGLLYGEPYQDFLCERHLMLAVVVDAVNEKLFDYFGDTAIVFDGDTPQVLADYKEEIAAILL